MNRALLALALVLLVPAAARAQEPAKQRSMDIDIEDTGFGQDPDEPPRLPRVRIELDALGAWMDSEFRNGKAGLSNRFNPQYDLGLPRFTLGEHVSFTLKLHRYFAIGAEYFRLSSEGRKVRTRSDFRMGDLPSEVPPYSFVAAAMELQQATFTLRFVLADDAEIRAEFSGGITWVSYRLGFHPQNPPPPPSAFDSNGRLPGGGVFAGSSKSNEALLAPSIGTFFAWNFHPNIAVYVESVSSYFSFWKQFGSLASINRAGLRWRVWEGLEIVTGVFVVSGQVYDIRDRLDVVGVGSSHHFRQASWLGGGPELGVSFTY